MFQELKATCSNPPGYLVAQMAWEKNQGVPFKLNASLAAVLTLEDISSHQPVVKFLSLEHIHQAMPVRGHARNG